MNILLWIVFGALAGWVASLIMRTDRQQGALANIVLEIVGALAGGFLMGLFGEPGVTGFNLYSIFVAVLGSVVVIYISSLLA